MQVATGKKDQRRSARRRRRLSLRWLALGSLAAVSLLYYRPVTSYLQTRDALARRVAEVRTLEGERRVLERRLREAETPDALAREARRLGLIKAGERLFIVKGIPQWRAARGRRRTLRTRDR